MTNAAGIPSVSVSLAQTGASAKANALGMRPHAGGEPIRSEASNISSSSRLRLPEKSRALMFIALDKLRNQSLKQAIIVVPERSIGSSFADEPLSKFGFWADWTIKPQWNLCNAPGADSPRTDSTNVGAVKKFLESGDDAMVCTHATFRFAFERFGVDAFDDRLIAVDEFHHISVDENNVLGSQVSQLIARAKTHLVAMTGSYFRGDAAPVLSPEDETRFETVHVYLFRTAQRIRIP